MNGRGVIKGSSGTYQPGTILEKVVLIQLPTIYLKDAS